MAKAAKTTNPETLAEEKAEAPKVPRVTKQQIMIDMLSRPEGATIEELASYCQIWCPSVPHAAA